MADKATPVRGLPVRVRVVVTLVLLTAGALLVVGLTASALQAVQVTNSIDDDLRASAAEFRNLAESGTNPETGEPFSNASDLLRVSMGRVVAQHDEGLLGSAVAHREANVREMKVSARRLALSWLAKSALPAAWANRAPSQRASAWRA